MKPIWLTGLLFLLSFLAIADEKLHFSATSPLIYPISLSHTSYVRGTINTERDFASAVLMNSKGEKVKHLSERANELRLYLKPEHSGDYVIKLTSEVNNSAQVQLHPAIEQPVQMAAAPLLSQRLGLLQQELAEGEGTDDFWQEMAASGTPLVEYQDDDSALVTFLWRGAKHNVQLYGAPFGSHQNLVRLADSDVWFKTYALPSDTVMAYQLAPDVPAVPGQVRASRIAILATKQQDPLNNKPWLVEHSDKYNVQSTVVLKDAKMWIESKSPMAETELVLSHFQSKLLNNTRKVALYRHPKAKSNAPLLIFFDGDAYTSKVPSPYIIEQLVNRGLMPAVNAAFIYNPSRSARGKELPANPLFAKAMAEEFHPWLLQQGLRPEAKNMTLIGSSYGGLASLYIAFSYPELFGKVLSQSGSFWWSPRQGSKAETEPQWLTRHIAERPRQDIQIYLNAGVFETGYFTIDILESNRHLRDVLTAKNYSFDYSEFSGGHDYFAWRNELSKGLITLFKQTPE